MADAAWSKQRSVDTSSPRHMMSWCTRRPVPSRLPRCTNAGQRGILVGAQIGTDCHVLLGQFVRRPRPLRPRCQFAQPVTPPCLDHIRYADPESICRRAGTQFVRS
jgi:hypothetical protein